MGCAPCLYATSRLSFLVFYPDGMPSYVLVQELPTTAQLDAVMEAIIQAGFQDVVATYGPTPHPVSGTGLTVVLNHPDPERMVQARKCWVDELARLGFHATMA